ncbi:MAG: hypothetical protein IJ060_05555 [Oscillospiraceae bacterium]|nr:hypothetical protein [Oscillospiraceae bacterium]
MRMITKIMIAAAVLSGTVTFHVTRNGDSVNVETTVNNPEEIVENACGFVSDTAHAVNEMLTESESAADETGCFRIRRTWEDVSSQVGAYQYSESAISVCPAGYSVYDAAGALIYTAE